MADAGPDGSQPRLLHELFLRAAARWPERVAIEVPAGHDQPARRTTYGELLAEATRVRRLVQPFVGGEAVVAILLPRDSARLFAAQIGVLMAGAAFVCPDVAFPDDLVRFVLDDAGAVAVLTDTQGAERLRGGPIAAERVVDVTAAQPSGGEPASPAWLGPSSLAYVIYTSGTTGQPKGVLLEHKGIVNLIAEGLERFGILPEDRVAQGSSHAYDSSLEETWLALGGGAAVVVLDEETVRSGPDLMPLLRRERVSILMPTPTLLRTLGCQDPRRELPDLRLVYVGGEAMPQELADLWAGSVWVENGYGPTECTVTVVRGPLRGGQPVTIGRPVAGHRAVLLDKTGDEVADGAVGELHLGGVGLARGYLGRPELTAERFPAHPLHGRLYRTGDLAVRDADGTLRCLGRADTQVKVRGHRLELEAIESLLAQEPGVRAAACAVRGTAGREELLAFVVAADAAQPPAEQALAASLRRRLPEPAVPARFVFLDRLPTTVGGKLDRRALPEAPRVAPPSSGSRNGQARAVESDAVEARIADVMAETLALASVASDADFFAMGGNSVRAAELISKLRFSTATAGLAVRDVYEARCARALALRARAARPAAEAAASPVLRRWPRLVTAAQAAWLFSLLAAGSAIAWAVANVLVPAALARVGPVVLLLATPVVAWAALLLWAPLAVVLAVLGKRVLIGRYEAGRWAVWSGFHLRHWLVQRLVRLVPWSLFEGTVFQCAALRALGARIGRRVHVHRGVDLLAGGWDLLDIGDDVSLAQDAALGLVELDAGSVVFGRVVLGHGTTLDVRAGVSGDTVLEPGAGLAALSWLPRGSRVPRDELWSGVPAGRVGRTTPPASPTGRQLAPAAHGALLVASRVLLGLTSTLPLALVAGLAIAWSGISHAELVAWLEAPWGSAGVTGALLALAAAHLPVSLVLQALALRATSIPAQTMSRWSPDYIGVWLRAAVVQDACRWLSGSLLWPVWLRLAGMRVGRDCEISGILDTLPEQVTIGESSFLADGIYLAGPRIHRGSVEIAPVELGRDTFLGNHVVVPAGTRLPDSVLLGVATVADPGLMRRGSAWFGQPPFELPRREVVACDRRLTHRPGPVRYGNRLFWEALRAALPAVLAATALLWLELAGLAADLLAGPWLWIVGLPLASLVSLGVLPVVVLACKWLLLGRVRPGHHALWSCWCCRWDFFYMAADVLARPVLAPLEGTLLLSPYLRALGVRLGRRVVMGSGFAQVVDPDLLRIEDDATVDALFQAHSFEDRVLKLGYVRIGRGASVGRAAVLLYGCDVGLGCRVAPHGVVMKNERLLGGCAYEGAPARPA